MTLHDKISRIVVNRMKTSPYFAERTADAILKLPEIADLKAKRAEVEAERDALRECVHLRMDLTNHHNAAKCPYCAPRAEAAEHNFSIAYDAKEKAEAALFRAYRMGLEAAANVRVQGTVGMVGLTDRVSDAIRAIQPPADLVERVAKDDVLHLVHPDGYCEGCGDTPCKEPKP